MKYIFLLSFVIAIKGNTQPITFFSATFSNKNVYKTKEKLDVTPVYHVTDGVTNSPAYSIVPNNGYVFIRYKVLSEDENNKYIKILNGCHFVPNNEIVGGSAAAGVSDVPEDYVYRIDKKPLLSKHYLASSHILGKLMTIPIRIRKEPWTGKATVQGAPSLFYAFGWKLKIGNNPYTTKYLSIIPYAVGVSAQKYFKVLQDISGKDSLSAKSDEFAVTYYTVGLAFEVDKFNIGFFAGTDRMFGDLKKWVYQKKWWFGIGIGYELFK